MNFSHRASCRNPNNNSDPILSDMFWPKHNTSHEFFMDWGTHMIEKNGLHLERYRVWETSSAAAVGVKTLIVLVAVWFLKFLN